MHRLREAIMNAVRIFIVSAQDIFRTGLMTIVRNELPSSIIGASNLLPSEIHSATAIPPDLIVLDLYLMDLACSLVDLLRLSSHLIHRTVVITSGSTDFELTRCVEAGFSGIICRNASREEILFAIRRVLGGRTHYCSSTNSALRKERMLRNLTKRELEVLQYLAVGLSNKEIAEKLSVGVGTIKTHLININSKLNVASRTEAVIRGVQQRLISIKPWDNE